MNGPTAQAELDRLRRMERAFRQTLIQRLRDGDWDLADLQSALDEAGLKPYGREEHVLVTITFKVGLEDEDPPRPRDLENYVEALRDVANDDTDWVILDPEDEIFVSVGPIQRGSLPS